MFSSKNSFHVLYTTDVKKTHTFFSSIGATIQKLEDDKVVVQIGGFDLHFILSSTEPHDAYRSIAEPPGYGHGVIFYLECEDIHKAKDLVERSGGTIKADVYDNHWGCKEFLFTDPNGYAFSVYI